jgi:rhodanese-related sulfurtransferase
VSMPCNRSMPLRPTAQPANGNFAMSLSTISPGKAKRLVDEGAILIDIREADEHAREHIPGAHHLAFSMFDTADLVEHRGKPVIFHCHSGGRTLAYAPRLAAKAVDASQALILAGGFEAWRRAGLPIVVDRRRPIDLQRQVHIATGSLGFLGVLLGVVVSPWFLAMPLVIGAGLFVAGVTGFCAMARLLVRAPWNRDTNGRLFARTLHAP